MTLGKTVLITNNKKRIVVKYSEFESTEVLDDLLICMQNRENWNVTEHSDTTAYLGNEQLFIINMSQVIGVGR